VSGVDEYWIPRGAAPVDVPYGISLAINQFHSSAQAAAYQAKFVAQLTPQVIDKGAAGVHAHIIPLKLRDIPGAVADTVKIEGPAALKTTITLVLAAYHRGPYLVMIASGQTTTAGHLDHLIEGLATTQFGRLPH
jgi:hypothetical protein